MANKLSNYRIEQLEKKVSEHNKVVERTFQLEGRHDRGGTRYPGFKSEKGLIIWKL